MRRPPWYISLITFSLAALIGYYAMKWRSSPQPAITPEQRFRTEALIEKLKPLHKTIRPPGPNDWLAEHKEPGQTYAQYASSAPTTALGKRRIIYVQPLGDFTPTQRKIVQLSADFMSKYFELPVKIREDLPLEKIPESARRINPHTEKLQILSTYVLDTVLAPSLPDDAAALIAFSATDLWPGQGWNFVFGQASLQQRVGVWSTARFGDPDAGNDAFRLCLLRTLKTATHETGHMFSIYHCTAYECNMCGSNHLQESDRKPLEVCPECVAKIWYATGADPLKRFQVLETFCRDNGLPDEASVYKRSAEAISE